MSPEPQPSERPASSSLLRRFFALRTSAVNLAVFRIVVFGGLIWLGSRPSANAVMYSWLPEALRVAPPGWGWLLSHLPILPEVVGPLQILFFVSSAMAAVGLWTRGSSVIAVVSGLFVLGVPQFFGKINHYHFLWWFALLLALSPSGDALSVDSWQRRAKPSGPSLSYGLPLRFAWLLLALVYLFPGLWKLLAGDPAWVFGDNLKMQLHATWLQLGGYLPAFRLDHHPWLLQGLSVGTIAFEVLFLPLLFFPRWRPWLIVAGVGFHLGIDLFMKISFIPLVSCYVMFVDWDRLWRQRRLSLLASRVPRPEEIGGASPGGDRRWRASAIGGSALLLANVVCGALAIDTWPVAVFPRFHRAPAPTTTSLVAVSVEAGGEEEELDTAHLRRRFGAGLWSRVMRRAVAASDPARRSELFAALSLMYRLESPDLQERRTLRIYGEHLAIDPAAWPQNPLDRKLFLEIDLEAPGDESLEAPRD